MIEVTALKKETDEASKHRLKEAEEKVRERYAFMIICNVSNFFLFTAVGFER